MVGIKLFNPNHLGLVTVIATLVVAAIVNGESGVVFDAEDESLVTLQCEDTSSKPWTINTDEKVSPNKKIFILPPDSEGCLKFKNPIVLNSTSKFIVKFHSDVAQGENGKVFLHLLPLEGKCPDEECLWEIPKESQHKEGEWVTAEHEFPLKSKNEYYVNLKADKLKGKFLLESIAIPNGRSSNFKGKNHLSGIQEHQISYENATTKPSGAVGIGDFGKNLLFTTASVLTLNNLLN